MEQCLMKLDKIGKSFFGVPALKNVDFEIHPGKVHALIGENGAGKSTLMKIMTGIYIRDSGDMFLDGEPVNFRNYQEAMDEGISMMFQEMSGVPTLTVLQNIFLNNEMHKRKVFLDKPAMREKAESLIKLLGLEMDLDSPLESLSVGERQMIEIVKALAHDARILVMDEPTASLSAKEVEKLFRIIRNLKKEGIAIVYISHRMNEILEIADDVTVLRDGEKVAALPNEYLTLDTMINHMMGGKTGKSFEWHPPAIPVSEESLLEVEHIKVNNWVEDISFSVHKGEVLGFAGLLNSGRTEIVESIFGIRRMQRGTVRVSGKPLKIKSVNHAVQAGIGLVPEDRRTKGLILIHSVKQNLTLPFLDRLRRGLLLNKERIRQVTNESITDLNIKTESIDALIRLLSGGNQQKVVIAKWLKADMKILLLDEPTVGVDIGAKKELINIIRDFTNQGNAAVMISSEMAELMAVCDRILVLKRGQIIDELRHEEIGSEEVLQNAIQK